MKGLGALIRTHAAANGLDPLIVAAVICQESSGYQYAGRIEQTSKIWFTLFGRKRSEMAGWCPAEGELPELWDECCLRASSFGFMQVLGETARVLGFSGRFLWALFDPETNLHYGCVYLARCLKRARAALPGAAENTLYNHALYLYNGSRSYPAKVRSHIGSGAAALLLNDGDPFPQR